MKVTPHHWRAFAENIFNKENIKIQMFELVEVIEVQAKINWLLKICIHTSYDALVPKRYLEELSYIKLRFKRRLKRRMKRNMKMSMNRSLKKSLKSCMKRSLKGSRKISMKSGLKRSMKRNMKNLKSLVQRFSKWLIPTPWDRHQFTRG